MDRLGAKGVGKSFFVYKYKEHIDLSLPRIESKVGRGHRGFEVKLAKNEKEASVRRDFRMNALMLNVFDAKLLDFWGGIEDIVKKRIGIIDEEKFKEDSLRVLRGVQFSARFGYKIEPKSCEVMRTIELDDLSHERIFWEFEKLFKGEFLHYGLYYLKVLGVDRKIFGFTFKSFFKTACELIRAMPHFQKHLRKFYFLYILAKNEHKPFERFLDALRTPNEYYRAFRHQKKLPKIRTDRFIAAIALNVPIMNFLGNYAQDVTIRAKKFDLWEKKFSAVTPKELMAEGFKGAELGKELRRRNLQAIKERFKGRE
jgi:tRNA nucleotidyltransferase (CCA-adding enzyme)